MHPTASGGTLGPKTACTFSVTLQTPAGVSVGRTVTNTTSPVRGNIGGIVTGDVATDELVIAGAGAIIIDKVTRPPGDLTRFDFTLRGGPLALNQPFSLGDTDPPS